MYKTAEGRWDVDALLRARAAGLTLQAIATKAGVTRQCLSQLLRRADARRALGLPIYQCKSIKGGFYTSTHNRLDERSEA